MFWVFWLVVAVLAFAGELTSLALYLASFGGGALAAAIVALFLPLPAQVAALVVVTSVLLFGVRPIALGLLPTSGDSAEPRLGPGGRTGVAVSAIDRQGGEIRVGQGEFWSARPVVEGDRIPPGTEVEIESMQGLTARVRAIPAPAPLTVDVSDGEGNSYGLSPREIEVLSLMAAGLTNAEIAERLILSPRTVHHHVSHILTKMNVDGRVDAVRLALQGGLVTPVSGD